MEYMLDYANDGTRIRYTYLLQRLQEVAVEIDIVESEIICIELDMDIAITVQDIEEFKLLEKAFEETTLELCKLYELDGVLDEFLKKEKDTLASEYKRTKEHISILFI